MSDALPWADANAACQAAGLQLASVQSAAQNALLLAAAAGNKVWTGGTDAASEGAWVWSPSNTPLSYTKWNKGEPNDHGSGEDCLEFKEELNSEGPGKWNDISCARTLKYVCQTTCPVPPPSPPGTFTSTASLKGAVQAFNANPASANATYGPIADWDVSAITDMSGIFKDLQNFDADVSNWQTSSVTNMYRMFQVHFSPALPRASSRTHPLHAACA